MQFLYLAESGDATVELKDEPFRYLIKARREKAGSRIFTRNLNDALLYTYELTDIGKRNATLTLIEQEEKRIAGGNLHLGWCVIDPKTVEKSLPQLNQIGVSKITFIRCDYSQKNFKPSLERMEKILINSCEQCGRSDLMRIDFCDDLKTFLDSNPSCAILDFNPNSTFEESSADTILVGCEGGFSESERALFTDKTALSFSVPLILKSETAAIAAASKLLL